MYEGKHIHFSEVDNKPLCSYSPKLCKQRRLNGYAFCIRHVLEDKTAPFKQCEYVAKYNSQRCTNPIPKSEDRRYCNSHLQVLGFIPKKERKKKNDPIDEVKVRHQMDTMAFSLTVPTLALKMPNGLDGMSLSPPGARVPLHYLETELEDPFAFNEEDDDLKKGATVRKKLQSKLAQNRQRQRETEILKVRQEHFSPPPAPSQQQPPQQHPHPSPSPTSLKPPAPPPPQGFVCKSPPPPNTSLPLQGVAPTTHTIAQARQSSHKRPLPLLPSGRAPATDPPSTDRVLMKATAFSPHFSCISRLQRLVRLCTQKHQLDTDLFPHLGLDWSEESGEEPEDSEQASPYQVAWSIRETLRYERHTSDDDDTESRSSRVTQLCTYFQQKYKHLCRLERAESRQKKCRHTFRKALLQAASREPECTGQLIQELQRAACSRTSISRTKLREVEPAACSGTVKGEQCPNKALPFTRHCFQHILLNRSQQLFSSCTAKFADGQQCSVPVFDITHQTPLCEEHAKKMDNFLRGDSSRKVQHQQQRKPRKKTKPPALTKKHKKKRRRGPRRPQKPIPPAVPQGNLSMPTSVSLPVETAQIRSPSTPELSADELPDDIANEITDIPHDLELNQEDFSDVLPRLPDDLQDFDFFEGKNGDLLPTTEEAEELERALQAVTSLECLSTIGVLTQSDGVPVQELSERGIGVFSTGTGASGIQSLSREVNTDLGELLNGRIVHDNFSSLELDENLLRSATLSNPPTPLAGQIQGQFSAPANVGLTSATLISQSALGERAFPGQFHGLHDGSHASQRPHPAQLLSKADDLITSRQQYSSDHSHSSPHGSHYDSEHVPSPYSDHITSPHTTSYSGDNMAATFSAEMPIMAQHLLPTQLEVPLGGVVNPRTHWGNLPVNLGDPSPFSNLLGADGHLLSTSLSTPPTTSNSETTQPAFATVTPSSSSVLPGLPQTSFSGMGPSAELMASTSPKQQLPQFSAAFGHQLSSHSGIPKDLQPSHSSIAPPTGFTVTGATATSTNNASSPFTSPN
ncbi:INO80 complex subunit D isoform X1 [Felis catus]|uniref:KANL2-like probable zinc-finger domain-containing protein n=2 Tax=Felis catus TaxID=9685 RepID=A0ABI7ZAS1_FELCA|nr:INO80 complex subunit D isoform X1 [Felis catus]XP_044890301.1 INO80 complex subunit D isoform X1 [Felis catus]XP_044890302.1 INO80 complex subunit D isoform X1 [Felis catus]XP_044890303.1 INO80 complex subunit D isoform X1 [Felis catus]XP_044890304.1 INO80 complex subunit D isoform X1 [Felis catus]